MSLRLCQNPMPWKNLVLKLFSQMLDSANQVAGFFKVEYRLNYMRYQLNSLCADRYPLLLQIDHGIIAQQIQVWLWAWSGILRHAQSVPKQQVFNISTMIKAIVLIFCVQVKFHQSCKIIFPIYLVGVARHAQCAEITSFQYLINVLSYGFDFLHTGKAL